MRNDFADDIRSLQKLRARDRSDQDNNFKELDKQWTRISGSTERHEAFLGSISKMLTIVIESLNMQMEAENADLLDRQLMALYGVQADRPTKMDLFGHQSQSIHEQGKAAQRAFERHSLLKTVDSDAGARDRAPQLAKEPSAQSLSAGPKREERKSELAQRDGSVEQILDRAGIESLGNSVDHITMKATHEAEVGQASASRGEAPDLGLLREELPIKIDKTCLSHQTSGKDAQLTL